MALVRASGEDEDACQRTRRRRHDPRQWRAGEEAKLVTGTRAGRRGSAADQA